MDPRSGGALLVRVPDDNVQQSLTDLRNEDPFFQEEHRQLRTDSLESGIGKEDLDKL